MYMYATRHAPINVYLLLEAHPAKMGIKGARPAIAKNIGRDKLPMSHNTQFLSQGIRINARAGMVDARTGIAAKNHLLTSGHDLDVLQMPVGIDVAAGDEQYVSINGRTLQLKPRDMYIADAEGIISSVIYGPDQRTRINPQTRRVLFTVYAPPGIVETAVADHLHDIQCNVLLIAPKAEIELFAVYR